jgi:transcriptional regulator with XRE-family HTH domain
VNLARRDGSVRTGGRRLNAIDAHVGARIRLRRSVLRMSQEHLGRVLGVSFQQVQKYERGTNKVGASRLYDMAIALGVPVSFFFEDMAAEIIPARPSRPNEPVSSGPGRDPLSRPETRELVQSYYDISDRNARRRLYQLIKAIARLNGT